MAIPTSSILLTVKKMLGIAEEYTAFDIDLIVNINSVFLTLNQLGVGPKTPYQIEGADETWSDFLGDQKNGEYAVVGVPTYVYLKTRLLFDPPTNSFLVDAVKKQCEEFEWRLNVQAERGDTNGDLLNEPSSKPDDDNESGNDISESARAREVELLRASWNKGHALGD